MVKTLWKELIKYTKTTQVIGLT